MTPPSGGPAFQQKPPQIFTDNSPSAVRNSGQLRLSHQNPMAKGCYSNRLAATSGGQMDHFDKLYQ